jgi:hypothetical protein
MLCTRKNIFVHCNQYRGGGKERFYNDMGWFSEAFLKSGVLEFVCKD